LKEQVLQLAPKYQSFLAEVDVLISTDEMEIFLGLDEDYERDSFIEEFWRSRDPYGNTARNEFKRQWEERLEMVRANFVDFDEDRARILLLNGAPDARIEVRCPIVWPAEVWYYEKDERVPDDLLLLFYQRYGQYEWRLWQPIGGLGDLAKDDFGFNPDDRTVINAIRDRCLDDDALLGVLNFAFSQGALGYPTMLMRLMAPIESPSGEWVATFSSYSTDLPSEAATFPAEVSFDFPGRHQSRTVVQGQIKVAGEDLGLAELAGSRSRNLLLTGEVLLGEGLFDRFRYKFDFPDDAAPAEGSAAPTIPILFQRQLRPGSYRVILRLEDLNRDQFFRTDLTLDVPAVATQPPPPADPETARLLEEANRAISRHDNTLEILEPMGAMQLGHVRFETLTTGSGIQNVVFSLDGKPVLDKRKPPFSVDLDLGRLPKSQLLAATAYDEAGEVVAYDELLINASAHRFSVRLDSPRPGEKYHESFRAHAVVEVPEGQAVERVEFYLDQDLVATLYQPPYEQPIVLPEPDMLVYTRAVAYLVDGNSTDAQVVVNPPEGLEEIDVQFVELFATVRNRDGRPVEGLTEADFKVVEDGVPQTITRFDKVDDLPFHATLLLDVSASMAENLPDAQRAALGFFQEAISSRDRAALITFNDRPFLAQKFTNRMVSLGGGLAGLKAERGTALYDSVVFALYYFNGIKGQRALLVISDGKDESSRFDFPETLDFTRRAGVTIYTIGIGFAKREFEARRKLSRLAEETGGQSFFVDDGAALEEIYDQIEAELRSQYLIAYQSTNPSHSDEFRTIDLEVLPSGMKAETIRGYYP
jgi:VWFA-related protein